MQSIFRARPRFRLRTLFLAVLAAAVGVAAYRQWRRPQRWSFELVHIGMTQEEVLRELGPPAESHCCQMMFRSFRCDEIWHYPVNELDGPCHLQIWFSRGRVAYGYCLEDGPNPSCIAVPILPAPAPSRGLQSWPGLSSR